MNLNSEPKIIGMAYALDLDVQSPVESLLQYCIARVSGFARGAQKIRGISDLQKLVCSKLNLQIHEVWTDEGLKRTAEEFIARGEIAAAAFLTTQFKPDTFGMLVQLHKRGSNGRVAFVAFIDCRGDKYFRRDFTVWHEITHCLTLKDQLSLPLRRSTVEMLEKDPIEKVTDLIAAHLAFFDPLFLPVISAELSTGPFTFESAERVRKQYNEDASFLATLNACVSRLSVPMILLEVEVSLKKKEADLIRTGKASESDFIPVLRVVRSSPNQLARTALPFIPRFMRVPDSSIIADVHTRSLTSRLSASHAENLKAWTTSTGGALPDRRVRIQARKIGGRTFALIGLIS